MFNIRVSEENRAIYIDVSGYITTRETKTFLAEYKQKTKMLRNSSYNLIVTPSVFDCENENDIRNICMTFFKGGYRKMYLVDPDNYILSNMELSRIEEKMFNKAVKIVPSLAHIK